MLTQVYIHLDVALAGLVSFLSPCVLPLVPPYLGYISSTTIEQMTDQGGIDAHVWRRVVLASPCFGVGFTTRVRHPELRRADRGREGLHRGRLGLRQPGHRGPTHLGRDRLPPQRPPGALPAAAQIGQDRARGWVTAKHGNAPERRRANSSA